jgi:hypothetical protein
MTVAWSRGFFRLWIVASILWVTLIAAVAMRDDSIPSVRKSCDLLLSFKNDTTGQPLGTAHVAQCEAVWRAERLRLAAIALGPPGTLLILGLAISWIVRGFRSR